MGDVLDRVMPKDGGDGCVNPDTKFIMAVMAMAALRDIGLCPKGMFIVSWFIMRRFDVLQRRYSALGDVRS